MANPQKEREEMIFKWLKKRRQQRDREIANAVYDRLSPGGWKKFLPPVVLRDKIYLVTEDGTVYSLHENHDGRAEVCRIITM